MEFSTYLSIDKNGSLVVPIVNFSVSSSEKKLQKHETDRFSEVLGFKTSLSPITGKIVICTFSKRKKL